jgi:hypothetical protein
MTVSRDFTTNIFSISLTLAFGDNWTRCHTLDPYTMYNEYTLRAHSLAIYYTDYAWCPLGPAVREIRAAALRVKYTVQYK